MQHHRFTSAVVLRWRDVYGRNGANSNLVLAMVTRQQTSTHLLVGHSMCTSDAWRHEGSMRQCSGDL